MRYVDFRDAIEKALQKYLDGLIWPQLRDGCRLPYKSPCQTWVKQLERDIGLIRVKGSGRAFVWRIRPAARPYQEAGSSTPHTTAPVAMAIAVAKKQRQQEAGEARSSFFGVEARR